MIDIDLDKIVNGYLQCALFTGVTDDGEPLDYIYSIEDFEDEAVEQAQKTCALFVQENMSDVSALLNPPPPGAENVDNEDIGIDIWFTVGGHGTGFWDRGYGEIGKRLTAYCHKLPERNVFAPESDEYENGATLVIE